MVCVILAEVRQMPNGPFTYSPAYPPDNLDIKQGARDSQVFMARIDHLRVSHSPTWQI